LIHCDVSLQNENVRQCTRNKMKKENAYELPI
jgi:hypothetical protein